VRAAVIGAGAWGTALADVLARNGHQVGLWARETDVVTSINERHENARFLAGIPLHAGVHAHDDMAQALDGAALAIFAAPSHVLRTVARHAAPVVGRDTVIAVATKGIERESLALMTDVVEQEVGHPDVVALSGPSFAAEVARRQPTALVAAARIESHASLAQQLLSSPEFRVYTSSDVIGVELGGALKNVMAVATGVVDGLQLGFNARAALITRGLAEMIRLGIPLGAQAATFAGLAGLGDLVLTCTGALSRNRAVGLAIGEGQTLAQATEGKETVAEGVLNAQSAQALAARVGVEMPIVEATHRILFEGVPPRTAVADLMRRELRAEQDRA
jgi:glycerol-3-phosphate dehydrogenase (NAD(P)+)